MYLDNIIRSGYFLHENIVIMNISSFIENDGLVDISHIKTISDIIVEAEVEAEAEDQLPLPCLSGWMNYFEKHFLSHELDILRCGMLLYKSQIPYNELCDISNKTTNPNKVFDFKYISISISGCLMVHPSFP